MTISKPSQETMDAVHWKIYQAEQSGKEQYHGSCVIRDPAWGSRCRKIDANRKYWDEVESLLSPVEEEQ